MVIDPRVLLTQARSMASRLVPAPEIEDAASEGVLGALTNLSQVDPRSSERAAYAFLYRKMRWSILDYARRLRAQRRLEPLVAEPVALPADSAEGREEIARVVRAGKRLPQGQRAAVERQVLVLVGEDGGAGDLQKHRQNFYRARQRLLARGITA